MPHLSLAARSQGTAKGVRGGRRGQGWDKGDWVGWGVAANALVTVLIDGHPARGVTGADECELASADREAACVLLGVGSRRTGA
jgi:hypothetical protein